MTTSQSRYQDPSPELDGSRAARPSRPQTQPVPPPQFGRLAHPKHSPETARARVPHPGQELSTNPVSGSRPVPPECPIPPDSPIPPDTTVVDVVRVPGPLADFRARTVSFLIDYVAPVVVLNLLLAIGAITGSTAWRLMLVTGGYLWLMGFCLWNSGYRQGTMGQSLGRRVANTKLVGIETGEPVGFRRAVVRQICHLVELGVGFLWPLWDGKRQTFADKIVGTVVVNVGEPTKEHVGEPTEDRGSTGHRRVGE